MTPERVGRDDDERLYQPRIHSRWIRELYRIRCNLAEPMTVLVDWALQEFVQRCRSAGDQQSDGPVGHRQSDQLPGPEEPQT